MPLTTSGTLAQCSNFFIFLFLKLRLQVTICTDICRFYEDRFSRIAHSSISDCELVIRCNSLVGFVDSRSDISSMD